MALESDSVSRRRFLIRFLELPPRIIPPSDNAPVGGSGLSPDEPGRKAASAAPLGLQSIEYKWVVAFGVDAEDDYNVKFVQSKVGSN